MPDRAGFEGFYRQHLARVTKACALVLADSAGAEEVAAEAFVRLWSRWSLIQDDDHAGGFVFKTAMRLCVKRLRSRRREASLTPAPERRGPDEMARVLDRGEIMAGLHDAQVERLVLHVLDSLRFQPG